jgi:hypothetical protein
MRSPARVLALLVVVLSLSVPLRASAETYCNWNSQGTCCGCKRIIPPPAPLVCASVLSGPGIVSCVQNEFGCEVQDQTPCTSGWCDPYYGPGC